MRYSCLHTHTVFCDGNDDVETYCRAAYDKRLFAIGFSAHAPITRKTGWTSDWHLPDERLHEYLDALHEARRRWEGKLRVFIGLEIDFIDGLMGPADRDYREMGLDYCIGSTHYLLPPHGAPFAVDGSPESFETGLREGFSNDIDALVNAYWDNEEAMIRAGGFDILGHIDLIKKNNANERWFSPESEMYRARLVRVAECVAQSRVPAVEVNTGGLNRGKTRETYPSLPLLTLLRARNVPAIITADAHRACHLDGHYETALATLLRAGYSDTVLYFDKTPVMEPLR
ncbi:MAG: histidinol-phosphatase [Treponema sp.]|jgi:histidinol-phosphatase (PHP family)|nr:histidinol-phosphatase [Treponema sp.]